MKATTIVTSWKAGTEIASVTVVTGLETIQRRCGGDITIAKTSAGGINLIPDSAAADKLLRDIMVVAGSGFTPEVVTIQD